jgi:hypothetical protein
VGQWASGRVGQGKREKGKKGESENFGSSLIAAKKHENTSMFQLPMEQQKYGWNHPFL